MFGRGEEELVSINQRGVGFDLHTFVAGLSEDKPTVLAKYLMGWLRRDWTLLEGKNWQLLDEERLVSLEPKRVKDLANCIYGN